jgi:hypothetical protein
MANFNPILSAAYQSGQTNANLDGIWHESLTYFLRTEIDTFQNSLARREILMKERANLVARIYS